ncbi:Guanylate cyclase soluble subunit beta-2 [Merluccius polli]|uniref:Guanylate cyclase soluble subunit beta-2 n=1 Tax=Merluccius polli TaxID=89951 RepID=A0AA47MMW9_MERPO|nr:Guanylate cyclase soluble subunit beta-2 [Merluccius polli]
MGSEEARQLGRGGSFSEGLEQATRHDPPPISSWSMGPWAPGPLAEGRLAWAAPGWIRGRLAADGCRWRSLRCLPTPPLAIAAVQGELVLGWLSSPRLLGQPFRVPSWSEEPHIGRQCGGVSSGHTPPKWLSFGALRHRTRVDVVQDGGDRQVFMSYEDGGDRQVFMSYEEGGDRQVFMSYKEGGDRQVSMSYKEGGDRQVFMSLIKREETDSTASLTPVVGDVLLSPPVSPCLPLQYGFINTCLKSLVTEKFGEETWEKLSSLAGVQDTFMTYEVYDDDLTLRLVREACGMLDVSSEVVLKLFGEHFFSFCKRSGYDAMLRTLGGNLTEFIENLDALHSYLALSYQEMNAPSFRVEKNERDEMLLHYYSDRRGLYHIVPGRTLADLYHILPGRTLADLYHILPGRTNTPYHILPGLADLYHILPGRTNRPPSPPGIIKAVARDFFNSEVTMTVLNQSEEDERTGKKEHVVFLVTQDRRTAVQEDGRTAVQEDGEVK